MTGLQTGWLHNVPHLYRLFDAAASILYRYYTSYTDIELHTDIESMGSHSTHQRSEVELEELEIPASNLHLRGSNFNTGTSSHRHHAHTPIR